MKTQNIKITSFDVDALGSVRASALMRYMQQIAREDLDQYGLTYQSMKSAGHVFVISKMRLKFIKPVVCEDLLSLSTVSKEVRGITFFRDFEVKRGNEKVACAASRWALLNYEKRVPAHPSVLGEGWPSFPDMGCGIETTRFRLPKEGFSVCDVRRVYPSMLDENAHLNNCVYADIISDYLDFNSNKIDEMQINFESEALEGDMLEIKKAVSDNETYITGKNLRTQKMCFEAQILKKF